MKTREIYELAVLMGKKADLRGAVKVKKHLEHTKAIYEKLDKDEKKYFDLERLSNPYADTRILVDNNKKEIKKILTGIDIDGSELLMAKDMGVDLVISHHPQGKALAGLHSVMALQAQVLADYGVPINIAESLMRPRMAEVGRGIHSANHNRVVDMAKLLKIDFMSTHTVADNMGANYLKQLIVKKDPEFLSDLVKLIKGIPEYEESMKINFGSKIYVGSPESSCGKIALTEFTGGTSGSREMYEKIANAGIGTVVGMHMHEEYRKEAEKYHVNVVIADHMASDSLGMNLFLDGIEKKGLDITACSGLIRIKR